MSDKQERLKTLLDEFRDSRAKATAMYAAFPKSEATPHNVLEVGDPEVAVYLNELNGSARALNDARELTGVGGQRLKDDHKPFACECCQHVVVPVPGDVLRNQPFGSVQSVQPVSQIGQTRRESVYDVEPWPPRPGSVPRLFHG